MYFIVCNRIVLGLIVYVCVYVYERERQMQVVIVAVGELFSLTATAAEVKRSTKLRQDNMPDRRKKQVGVCVCTVVQNYYLLL